MKLLVIGSGGREHAIVHKIIVDNPTARIFCAPGNAGISAIAECVPIAATDIAGLLAFAKGKQVDFTVVGPDDPLVMGVADAFEAEGLATFGPNKKAAAIEGSKVFAKALMKKHGIPTAAYEAFADYGEACAYVQGKEYPLVVKADGLALGKGVAICHSPEEALECIRSVMVDKKFGISGSKIVIEEYITGPEVSVLAFCDGQTVVPMVSAQDHKRAGDGDTGPNTGGMGAISPGRQYDADMARRCDREIFQPTLQALIQENIVYKGIIYFGLMLTPDGPKVIEYNCRFGDPEAQVVLPRLKSNLLDIMRACREGTLDASAVAWHDNAAACVVMASGGYPLAYEKGFEIHGLDKVGEGAVVYHAGTALRDGRVISDGGRVLGVTAMGNGLEQALQVAYKSVQQIVFEKMQYRKDIGMHGIR